jgi:hypothetical protein
MGRARIFAEPESVDALDLTAFAPKAAADPMATPPEQVRAIAEAANFRSREPLAAVHDAGAKRKRRPRLHRTGRNVQFNVKASQETVDAFYAISEGQTWVLGETLEHALAALRRELAAKT